MTIRARLVVGLGLVGLVLGLVCVVAVLRMRTMAGELRELAVRRVPGIVAVSDVVGQVNASSQALRALVVSDQRAERESASAAMLEADRRVGQGLERLARTASERGRSLLRDASTARDSYVAAINGIRRRALARPPHSEENGASCAGCHGSGGKEGDGGFKGMLALQSGYTGALEALVRHEGAAVDAQGQAMERSHAAALLVVVLLSLFGALVAIAVAVWLVRSTTRPLRRCTEVADRVAAGDTMVALETDRRDEAGALMAAMAEMVTRLRGLLTDMAAMAEQHDAGEIDALLDESRYQGAFREMARGVNRMVVGQIAANRKAMACVDELGRGNFEAALERFPGKLAFINETIERLRANLEAVASEVRELALAASQGRLAARGTSDRLAGDWRALVLGVNGIMDAMGNIIDLLPVPAMIIDDERSIRFLNATAASVGGRERAALIGTKCYETFKAGDCHDGSCACLRAMATGAPCTRETHARPRGLELEIQYSGVPLRSGDGAIEGAVEVIVDQTAIKAAQRRMAAVARYQEAEVARLAANLERVARGDLALDLAVAEADEETRETRAAFVTIGGSLAAAKAAVEALVADAVGLSRAAVEGRLETRADASQHRGDFQRIVEGVNETLDAVLSPIEEAAGVLAALASADLCARVTGSYQGGHAKIKESLNVMAEALHQAMAQVAEASDQVSAAASQIAASSQSVSQGASEQASSLEETSSTLEEISSMTRQNADNTAQAKAMAEAAQGSADAGSLAMGRLQDAMAKIRAASEATAEIIRDINEVAFQTNLLALNAAVEAARAGDAGRGFAVVAEEVRSLALRAKEAAKKTEALIRESVRLAGAGASISAEVGGSLGEMVTTVGKVTEIVAEIAAASAEQARGIDQVNRAVSQMDQVVQQAAASSEETSSAAEELAAQAQGLAAMVGRFQLARRGAGSEAEVRATRRSAAARAVRRPCSRSVASSPGG